MTSARKRNQPGGGCLSLFGLPFLATGLVLVWFYMSGYTDWLKARSWVEVPCWIETAELKVSQGDESVTYRALATYRYEYGGRTYWGERVSFGMGSDNVGTFHQDAHRELSGYLPGKGEVKPFRCYVNPSQPSESIVFRSIRWQMQAFFAIFALIFPPAGFAMVVGGWVGGRTSKQEAGLRVAHPQEPWKWKRAWAGEFIPEMSGGLRKAGYLYTAWAGLMILPLLLASIGSGAFVTDSSAWWLLLFPLLWIFPAWWCYKSFRRWLAVGNIRFQPTEIPARTGGRFSGAIVLRRPLPARLDAKVELMCEKRVSRSSGKNAHITTERIWSEEQTVPQDLMMRDVSGFRIPVSIQVPFDTPEADAGLPGAESCHWRLKLIVPGSPVGATFDVPVFKGDGQVPALSVVEATSVQEQVSEDLPAHLASRGLKAEFNASGIPVSIMSPPGRSRMALLILSFFNVIWTGVAIFLVLSDAPTVFKIVWPVTAAGIWIAVIWLRLHGRTVKVDGNEIVMENRLGPFSRSMRLDRSRVVSFTHDSNMTANDTRFYRVRVEDVMGRKFTLVDGLVASASAAELAARFQRWKAGS